MNMAVPATLLDAALVHLSEAGLEVARVSDEVVEVTGPAGSERYGLQVRSRVSAGSALAAPRVPDRKLLIVAPYVSEPVAEAWRHMDIYFVDTAGNMFLRGNGILVDVRGHRRPGVPGPTDPDRPLRAFKPSGLKVLFALLADRDLANRNYREIAHASGTALGTVQWVMKELAEGGYLDPSTTGRQLHRLRELFDRWVTAYALDLHPRLTLARFDAPDPTWWRDADAVLREAGAQWGGETAAHFLHRRLRPARAIVYATGIPRHLVVAYRLRKATAQGDVEIRQRFWHLPDDGHITVPSPLVYADLVASADPRQLEAASHLREHDAVLRRIDLG